MGRRGPLPCKTPGCGLVYTPGFFAEHDATYHGDMLGRFKPYAPIVGVVVEEVPFCGCTNEELERGRTCGQDQCPNNPGRRLSEYTQKVRER